MTELAYSPKIIRSNRKKSSAIQIKHGIVTVRVPKTISDRELAKLLAKHDKWIVKKLLEERNKPICPISTLQHGSSIYLLGSKYLLSRSDSDTNSISFENNELKISLKATNLVESQRQLEIKTLITQWYIQQAQIYCTQATAVISAAIGVTPQATKVKNYKARWGSCSAKKIITYNWRLIMAPKEVIDYVIVHELCHLIEFNHSKKFWQLVQQYCPTYKSHKSWLIDNGHTLVI